MGTPSQWLIGAGLVICFGSMIYDWFENLVTISRPSLWSFLAILFGLALILIGAALK